MDTHLLSLLRGIGLILFIVALAGVIAYIGDRVGHQIGRKRLTLFNIRPRYTSTIIAVGTGMIIALVITLIAIFASNQVQTAFFRLSEINAEIASAQARERELELKVTTSPVLVNLNSLMGPSVGRIPRNSPAGLRKDIVRNFYDQTVANLNGEYTRPPYNLKKFSPPSNVDKMLSSLAERPEMDAWTSQSDVLLIVTADQNLYPNDPIHFGITPVPDRLLVTSGVPIATLGPIPAGKNASADLALAELLNGAVPREMYLHRGMPFQFAGNVVPQRTFPGLPVMRRMLAVGGGTYVMTAFAATDIYPHTFGVPVVVTLQKVPPQ
jgi:hypothetical protein